MTALLLAALLVQAPAAPKPTVVIVHGAWGGGWDWRTVDSLLTKDGYKVVRVTLTGLGERHHLAAPNVGLYTHIDDVVNKILWDACMRPKRVSRLSRAGRCMRRLPGWSHSNPSREWL